MHPAGRLDMPSSEFDTLIEPLDSMLRRTIDVRYEVREIVGSGGMATVYRARDRRLDRQVAIKVLHSRFAADRELVTRFHREARFAAGLSAHPNIVSIYDVGDVDDIHYIVMELVEGQTLKELIGRHGPLPVARAFGIGQQLASALDFAHRQVLVHRDIKPQNILITENDQVKVTDFGIARGQESTQITRAGMLLGSAAYLSPEQALGKPVGASSDIYSAGVVLYEMLTSRLPFTADSAVGLAMQHVRADPPPPSAFNPAISAGDDAVVLRALGKTLKERYRSAAQLREALLAALAGYDGTTLHRPLTEPVSASPPRRRRLPRGTALVPAALVVGLLTVLIAWLAVGAVTGFGTNHQRAVHAGTATPVRAIVSHQATAAPRPTVRPTAPSPTVTSAPPQTPTTSPRSQGTKQHPAGSGKEKHGKGPHPDKAKQPSGVPQGQNDQGNGSEGD
jgi:serine/threonine protein kinase